MVFGTFMNMSIGCHKIRNKQAIHFITFAVVEWVDVFTRKDYCDIMLTSLKFCQEQKGLMLHGWCLMFNHVHLLASARDNDLSSILRDFKTHTSKAVVAAIQNHPGESRKQWMLPIFRRQGENNSRNSKHQFWQQENRPIECYSADFTVQKLTYIHNNPVKAGFVNKAEDYVYSSAGSYCLHRNDGLLKIDFI
jgi:putative transposase